MREDVLQTKKLAEVVNEVSVILENDHGEFQFIMEKICLDRLEMKIFKTEQGLFNLVQSYLLELETLDTRIQTVLQSDVAIRYLFYFGDFVEKYRIATCHENNMFFGYRYS